MSKSPESIARFRRASSGSKLLAAVVRSALSAFVMAASAPHPAAAETAMTFSHFVPTTHRVHAGAEMWAKSIEEASNGAIDIRIFPAQQLGKAVDHYDLVASGQVSAGWFVPGYTPGRFPIVEAGELPFMITEAAPGARALHEWYAQYAGREMPEIRFCAFATHDAGRIHTREPVTSIADMKGVKIRPASAVIGNYLSALGAVPVKLSAPEARQGVEQGVVDGVTFPWHTIINFGLAQDLRYHVDLPLYVPMAIYGINPDFYAGLSESQKKVVDDHCSPEWSEKLTADWANWEKEGRSEIEAMGGHEITAVNAEALRPWIAQAAGVYSAWAKEVAAKYSDIDPGSALTHLKERLRQAGAGQ